MVRAWARRPDAGTARGNATRGRGSLRGRDQRASGGQSLGPPCTKTLPQSRAPPACRSAPPCIRDRPVGRCEAPRSATHQVVLILSSASGTILWKEEERGAQMATAKHAPPVMLMRRATLPSARNETVHALAWIGRLLLSLEHGHAGIRSTSRRTVQVAPRRERTREGGLGHLCRSPILEASTLWQRHRSHSNRTGHEGPALRIHAPPPAPGRATAA